jgi:hypothetical protein
VAPPAAVPAAPPAVVPVAFPVPHVAPLRIRAELLKLHLIKDAKLFSTCWSKSNFTSACLNSPQATQMHP